MSANFKGGGDLSPPFNINNIADISRAVMVNPNRFYTYAYLRKDRTPYYIGKGKGNRAYKKYKNEIKIPKDKSRIIVLKQNLTEEEAFKHEIYMIAVLGRKDLGTGILRNKTDGGEGSVGLIMPDEAKQKISKVHKGKTLSEEHKQILEKYRVKKHCEESIEKMRKSKIGNKWNVGRKLSEEHKEKIRQINLNKVVSEETKQKISQAKKGKPQNEKQKETIKILSQKVKGTKWWNNGQITKRSVECPGNDWILGRL